MTAHPTKVHVSNGAGQRNYYAQCGRCPWFGVTTSDKGTAMSEKAEHELNGDLAGVRS